MIQTRSISTEIDEPIASVVDAAEALPVRNRRNRWKKLWLATALVLLFFPGVYVLLEFPTEARIIRHWSTSVVWKTQAEAPEYRGFGVWYIRQQHAGLSGRKLIAALERKYPQIDYSAIRKDHQKQLENLRHDRFSVLAEAITIYSCTIAVLYAIFWLVSSTLRGIRASLFRKRN